MTLQHQLSCNEEQIQLYKNDQENESRKKWYEVMQLKLEKTVIYTESVFKFSKLLEVVGISQNLFHI